MKTLRYVLTAMVLLGLCLTTGSLQAQDYERDYNDPGDQNDYYNDQGAIDRYLDAEIWTDHSDADYYVDDEVVIHFRTNRDAFVAIYSIDSRGMVNLLFPSEPAQDNFVRGGVTYSLPGPADDFELVLNGPEGSETIQIIASRERFPIPDWYHNSGLVFEGDDIYDYMDYLNGRHFVRYGGQRFAYDRAVVFVNEWEPDYFRPIYYPSYPSWAVVGNIYVDYPWGSTVYINGYYWGVTPLYVPRILVGWHTMTIYDRYGHCWENDFHVSRYHTSIFDRHVIITSSTIRSKYKRVRTVGYRNPVVNGYASYNKVVTGFKSRASVPGSKTVTKRTANSRDTGKGYVASKKRFVRGESELVKTERGYETRSTISTKSRSGSGSNVRSYSSDKSKSRSSGSSGTYSGSSRSSKSSGKTGSYTGSGKSSSAKSRSGSSGDYYKRKSGSSSSKSTGSQSSKTVRNKSKVKTSSSSKPTKSPGKSPTIKKSKDTNKQPASKGSDSKVTKSASPKSNPPATKSSSSKRSSSSSDKGKTRR